MAKVRDIAMERATQECEKPIFCQIENCLNREGVPTQICKARNYLKHLWQRHSLKHMYFCQTCERFFWCPSTLISHKEGKHWQLKIVNEISSKVWLGTEQIWSYQVKKYRQEEMGDVIYSKVAKLNENHEKLANAHSRRVKKVKGASQVKKAKKDTIRPPRLIVDATAVDAVVDTEIVNQLPPVVVRIAKVKHSVKG